MRVLLVNPMPSGLMRTSPPIGLGYIGASVKKASYDVKILDQTLKSSPKLQDVLREFRPDVVGITGISSQYPAMKEVARISKQFGCIVVAGGIHLSAYPEFILEDCKDIDFVVKGEGEYSFLDFLSGGSPVGIPGMYYRNTGHAEGSSPELITNLDSLPSPWTVLSPKDYCSYRPAGVVSRHPKIGVVLTSRGCPYSCTFCCASVVHGKKIRLRSVDNVLDEVELLVKSFGIKEIQIIDDNFTFYPEHVLGFCEGVKERKFKIAWTLTNGIRADRVNGEILREMKESGCYYIAIGVESGSERILKQVSKELSLGAVRTTVKIAGNLGIITQGFFMVGFPGETDKDREESLKFATSLPLDRMCVAPVMALPGSSLFSSQFSNSITNFDLTQSCYKEWQPLPGTPDYKTIKDFVRRMRIKFYLNPVRTVKHLLKVRTLHQLVGFVVGLKELF